MSRLANLSSRQKTALVVAGLGLLFLVPLRGLLRAQGPPMEEGFMLVFPERFLRGDIPNKDFLHLYGPGSVWVLAAIYKVFGVTLLNERLFGLAQMISIVAAMYGLARYWGRTVALFCGVIALVIILPPIGLTALAWTGGVGLGLLGLLATLTGRAKAGVGTKYGGRSDPEERRHASPDSTRGLGWALVGGLLAGAALLFRLDLVIAVGLATLAALWGTEWRFKLRYAAGIAVGGVGYLVHVAMAGPSTVFDGMIIDPVFNLRGGRKLPVPPPWDHLDGFLQKSGNYMPNHWPIPALTTSAQLFVWFFLLLAAVAFLLVVGIWAVRKDRASFQGRVLLAVALFSLGLVPQGMQRVDSAHFAWVSCVPFAFLPVAVLHLWRNRSPQQSYRRQSILAGGGVFLAMLLAIPQFTGWAYTDYVAQTFGKHRLVSPISRNGRTFYYGRQEVAEAALAMFQDVPRIAKPGDRLFVGTTDLRKTPLSEAYLYYLMPEFPPATYYIEMDPGVANAKDSRLASDLASADIAILSAAWNDWDEPNDSRKIGSVKPNRVLARDFCLVGSYGVYRTGEPLYQLLVKRPAGQPCPPGTTVPEPPGI